jgi:hypothetical protein
LFIRLRTVVSSCFILLLLTATLTYLAGCGQSPSPVSSSRVETERGSDADLATEQYDLERDEQLGGHTLKKHVGRTDAELQGRLMEERNISAASTWTDRAAAEETIARGLRRERGKVERWMERGYPRANLALHVDAGRVIGRSLRQGDSESVPCTSAVIVLRADGPDGFYVLTAYPEARK